MKGDQVNHSLRVVLFAAALGLASCALAVESDTLKRLDEALKAASTFEPGQNAGPLAEIEEIVFHLPPDAELREPIEEKLLEALRSATTSDGKRFLCRQLRVIGTERAVPDLEKLLTDPELSHMARYALGRMESPAASAALCQALGKTSGRVQAGIINTLRDRGCREARADIARLLGSADASVAGAAASALGRLGGAQSAAALKAARSEASAELGLEIDNALLDCAEQLAADGNTTQAADIYETFYRSGQPEQFQFAGLRGLVSTRQDEAVELLVEAIQEGDPQLRRFAISLVATVKGEQATGALVGVLASLSTEDQVLLLHALGRRRDGAAATEAIIASAKSQDEAVRIAALEALGHVGGASAVPALTEAASRAADGMEKEVARRSLLLLSGDDVDRALMQSFDDGGPQVQVEAIHALAGRGVTAAVSQLLKAAEAGDAPVRREATRALGVLAGKSDLGALVNLAAKAREPDDRSALLEAVAKAFLRVEDKDACAEAVLTQLGAAPADARPTLMRLLGKSGAPGAIQKVREASKDADPAIRDAAVRALSEWPDASAAEDLLELVAAADNPTHKGLALEGYLRMAGTSEDPTAMHLRVLKRVEQVEDKRAVLAGLGLTSDAPEALQLALGYLEDQPLQATAGLAALRIAHRLRQQNEPLARTALQKVLAAVEHEDVHQRAQEVLNDLDKYQDHILDWLGVGPFTEQGKDGPAVYATVFSPEQPESRDVQWQPITKGIGSWDINLEATFGGLDCCAAYLRTRVWSEAEQEAQLEMGSDDSIKAWLNGELVFDQWTENSAAPRQKLVKVRLAQGWNELMLKVVDQRGGWVFGCRLRKPDGTALEGLKIQSQ